MWEKTYVHLFDPDPRGVNWISVGESLNPVSIPRKKALELFVPTARRRVRPALHLGSYPEALEHIVQDGLQRAREVCVHERVVYSGTRGKVKDGVTHGAGVRLSNTGTSNLKADGAGGRLPSMGPAPTPGTKLIRGMSLTINTIVKRHEVVPIQSGRGDTFGGRAEATDNFGERVALGHRGRH